MTRIETIAGQFVLIYGADAPLIAAPGQAADLIGEALSGDAQLVAIPIQRLSADFLRLASGLAGEVLQKFVNYGLQVVILGDVSEAAQASAPLRDFIAESNRGRAVWFLPDAESLEAKLAERLRRPT